MTYTCFIDGSGTRFVIPSDRMAMTNFNGQISIWEVGVDFPDKGWTNCTLVSIEDDVFRACEWLTKGDE